MTLIIRDQLVTPPTWFSSFRDLTLYCSIFLKAQIVIETDGNPDPYWRWMKPKGGMDFVKDFVQPGIELGVRLDFEQRFPKTILADRIVPENFHDIVRRLKGCSGFLS